MMAISGLGSRCQTKSLYRHLVPKDPLENIRWRSKLIKSCREKASRRRAVIEMCRRDPVFWIDAFVWQYNPNFCGTNSLEFGPFITWPFQERAIEKIESCIERRRDLVIEKSRELGASWLCLLVQVHPLVFISRKKFLCISHNEKAVDDYSSDSLFWKIQFILDWLPEWMKPKIIQRDLNFISDNGTIISGQATTKRAGVGGRATAMFLDEFSQIRDAYDIVDRTSNTTGCRIFNGTHLGTGTAFFELTNRDSMIGKYVEKFQMHWSDHPDKNKGMYHYDDKAAKIVRHDPTYEYPPDFDFDKSCLPTGGPRPRLRSPWYDDACRRKTRSTAIAMDLDIDPQRSVEQLFEPLVINSLIAKYATEPKWEGDIIVDDEGNARLRKRIGGHLRLWLELDKDGKPPQDDYFIGCDNAFGRGATPSVGSGCNSRGEKVFEYANADIEATPMAHLFLPVLKLFCNSDGEGATVGWELPGPGATFGDRIIESGYRRIFYTLGENPLKKEKKKTPGWSNSPNSKMSLITAYSDALKAGHYVNRSEHSLKDCLNFRFKADGYIEHTGEASVKDHSGAKINHGDYVIADALSYKMLANSGRLLTKPGEVANNKLVVGSREWRMLVGEQQERELSWGES